MRRVNIKDFLMMAVIGLIFGSIAISFYLATGHIFYLYNFSIIGLSLMLGMGLWPLLPRRHKHNARRLSQLLVGGYLFFGLGMGLIYAFNNVLVPENMQIEGFWFMVFAGMFAAAAIHYMIAKIAGVVFFNRGWCGWACWTAAALDFLPWRRSPGRRSGWLGHIRYAHFALMLGLVVVLHAGGYTHKNTFGAHLLEGGAAPETITLYASYWDIPELWWFLTGNIFYFAAAFALAAALKDNRAFCKYLCPIVTFMKPGAHVSMLRIKADPSLCTRCGACDRNCPMDIKLTEYIERGSRITSTECIICQTCISTCPQGALSVSMGLDLARREHLRPSEPSGK